MELHAEFTAMPNVHYFLYSVADYTPAWASLHVHHHCCICLHSHVAAEKVPSGRENIVQ